MNIIKQSKDHKIVSYENMLWQMYNRYFFDTYAKCNPIPDIYSSITGDHLNEYCQYWEKQGIDINERESTLVSLLRRAALRELRGY